MKRNFTLRNMAALLLTALLAAGFWSCKDDDTQAGDGLELRYPGVTNIGPGMSFTMPAPSYVGPANPGQFAISGVSYQGQPFDATGVFAIDAQTGVVTIANTAALSAGAYTIGVSCVAMGRTYNYANAIKLNFSPSTPAGVVYSPSVMPVAFGAALVAGYVPDTTYIVQIDQSVTITQYELVQPAGKAYFSIDAATGRIWLGKGVNIPFGTYDLALKVTTPAGTKIYPDVVQFVITSAPQTLSYTPASAKAEEDQAFASAVPVLVGSLDGLEYSLEAVSPATDLIAVDASTGVISIAQDSGLALGTYTVDVRATNDFGTKVFPAAYAVEVTAYIEPVDNFSYASPQSFVQGTAFTIDKAAGFTGDDVEFSLVDLDAALAGKIAIDAQSGRITALKSNTIAVGTYTVTVNASNVKSDPLNPTNASFSLAITANPNWFTYVRWGNNLGLTPAADYADQFSYPEGTVNQTTGVPTSDAAVPLEFSIVGGLCANSLSSATGIQWSNPDFIAIDPATGEIAYKKKFMDGNSTVPAAGAIVVKAVAGKGTPGEIVRVFPVFFRNQTNGAGGVNIQFNPFAVKINPKTGGASAKVTLSGIADNTKFIIDYRRDAIFLDIRNDGLGVAGASGTPATTGTFLQNVWDNKYGTGNTGNKNAGSYYSNTANLGKALFYMDNAAPGQQTLKVNADKFVNTDGVYAKGVMKMQCTFRTDGVAANINTGSNFNGVMLYFDETF